MNENREETVGPRESASGLSPNQELLLMRHFDGELGWIGNWRAKQLLRNKAAQNYISELSALSKHGGAFAAVDLGKPVDLWSRIERRINEEEYTGVLLGNRASNANTQKIIWSQPLWRYGSVAAGAFVVFIAYFGGDSQVANAPISAVANSAAKSWQSLVPRAIERTSVDSIPSAEFVAMSNSRKRVDRMMEKRSQRRTNVGIAPSEIARMISEDATPFEVDWMRSDGRLSLIQSTPREPAIIWVKRNSPSAASTPRVIDRDFVAPQTVPAFK